MAHTTLAVGPGAAPIAQPSTLTALVTIRFFDDAAEAWLAAHGIKVRRSALADGKMDTELSVSELHELLDGAHAWIVGAAHVPRALLERAPELRIVARRGVGYDNVDVRAANELGKIVTITPGGNEAAVAEHAVAMMLALLKRLREFQDRMSFGNWDALPTRELQGKTVGLLGFGRIAQQVARRVACFDADVIATDPFADPALAVRAGVRLVDWPELLAASDLLSLHAPLTVATRNIVDASAIARMRPGTILVSTGRGGLIDEHALADALESGHLAGAGLDVFVAENNVSAMPIAQRLIASPRLLCSPHTAGSSVEGLARANMLAARCVRDVLIGVPPPEECLVRP